MRTLRKSSPGAAARATSDRSSSRSAANGFFSNYAARQARETRRERAGDLEIRAMPSSNWHPYLRARRLVVGFRRSNEWRTRRVSREGLYATRVKYRVGQKIEFPDFTVEYVGERRKSLALYAERIPLSRFQSQQRKGRENGFSGLPALASLIRPTSKSVANIISSNYVIRISSEN